MRHGGRPEDPAQLPLFPEAAGAATPTPPPDAPAPRRPDDPIHLGLHSTLRWSAQEGDLVLWCRWDHLAGPQGSLTDVDFWHLQAGDEVLITNVVADLPGWFRLHPLETAGSVAAWMMTQLSAGYKPEREPMTGPNLWRVLTGDRLAWVRPSAGEGEVIALVDLSANALVAGELRPEAEGDLPAFIGFGAPPPEPAAEGYAVYRTGLRAMAGLGPSREMSTEWRLGA